MEVGIETKLVIDTEIYDGFPSRKFKNGFRQKKNLKN